MRNKIIATLCILTAAAAFAQTRAASEAVLPPLPPWSGKSRPLVAPAGDRWITPAETSGLRTTPNYDETVAWLRKLVAAAPELEMISIGRSPEGREIWMVVASRERRFTAEALRKSGKPTVLAHGGIHAGEIDGKDAGMMLLRDMTVRGTKRELLDRANFLFVPILNVDGHERISRFGRINQRGPAESGWRTNAQNLNLNRDFAKLDTLEVQSIVRVLDEWDPEIYVDLHVTDGADYQYDITWGHNGTDAYSPAIVAWLERVLDPAIEHDLTAMGHVPGPLAVAGFEPTDPAQGITAWTAGPRFSNAYGDIRNIPSILVENHSLKPYDQRVLGTYVLLESMLRAAGASRDALRNAIAADRARRPAQIPVDWTAGDETTPFAFKAIESTLSFSPVSGTVRVEWTGKPYNVTVPLRRMNKPTGFATRPKAYWISAAWREVIDRLARHGIDMERIAAPREVDVVMYRLANAKSAAAPFEGRVGVTATPVAEKRRERFPAGSVRIPTDQPLGTLAVMLLEPISPDSFFQWGFFHAVLSRTEYVEGYVMEPMAERMLAENAKLAEEFRKKLLDDNAFRANAQERLQWFYERTPFFDERWRLYPVGREENE